ncbi:unnamed protein product [Rhizophagus irregularis]|uniref:Uncharacterized protein n=1 Tax=Rhizophagus irregularis TaxID=588596 RepID=A0A2I1F5V6_9GLOM|nr:hypothetical protein RhiirB3_484384 [Rhizophagus irregularis]CAB5389354.1 unnamed protein product [Rhizophagus irregularis]
MFQEIPLIRFSYYYKKIGKWIRKKCNNVAPIKRNTPNKKIDTSTLNEKSTLYEKINTCEKSTLNEEIDTSTLNEKSTLDGKSDTSTLIEKTDNEEGKSTTSTKRTFNSLGNFSNPFNSLRTFPNPFNSLGTFLKPFNSLGTFPKTSISLETFLKPLNSLGTKTSNFLETFSKAFNSLETSYYNCLCTSCGIAPSEKITSMLNNDTYETNTPATTLTFAIIIPVPDESKPII